MEQQEIARIERVLKKSQFKRIVAVHKLAERCIVDTGLVTQLSVLVDGLDELWIAYNTESDTVIDCLLDLGRELEYSVDQVVDLCELISFARATLNRCTSDKSNELSARGNSEAANEDSILEQNQRQDVREPDIGNNDSVLLHADPVPNGDSVLIRNMSNLKVARLP